MSALAPAAPAYEAADPFEATSGDGPGLDSGRLFESGGATLEDLISEAWDDLAAEGRTECPVCSQTMIVAGGCGGCGSELS